MLFEHQDERGDPVYTCIMDLKVPPLASEIRKDPF